MKGWLLLLAMAAHAQTVQGVAVNQATRKPVAGATVQLIGLAQEGDADIYRTKSDAAGRFRFDGVVPGRYRATADAPGFTRMTFEGRGPLVAVEASGAAHEVTITLTPASVISGRVADQDGDPIPYASVEALQYAYLSGKKALRSVRTIRTDDRGEYRLFGLPPGHYYVRATLRASAANVYPPTFFAGARDIAQASLVETTPGGEQRSIDILLRPDQLHSIAGKVVDGQTGQPAANVYVTARTADGFANGGPQLTDSFAIQGLAPGRYVLNAQEFSGSASKTARLPVELGSADLTGVLLTLSAGVEIAGTITTGGEAPAEAEKIHLSLEADDAAVDGPVTAKGTFSFRNVRPDHYHLLWTMPKGVYVKSIKLGDRVLPDDGIDLTGAPAPLTIQLATDGGRVQGVVRNSGGEPVAGAVVTMTADPSYDLWTATSNESGQFEISDIAPGDYRVLAFEQAPQGAPRDPDFRKPYEKSAVQVQVLPSTQQKIDLVAIVSR